MIDNRLRKFSLDEIYLIIDQAIKEESSRRTKYIVLNGDKHKDVIDKFNQRITALSELYFKFNSNGTW